MIRLLSLILVTAFFSCKKENAVALVPVINDTTSMPVKNDTIHSYLALGDSYTIGQSVAVGDGRTEKINFVNAPFKEHFTL